MPKERIYNQRRQEFDVEVRWSRESEYVSIATVMAPPHTSDAPQNLKELVSTWDDDGLHYPDGKIGLYADLSRYELNELIRVLRRARDQAFGKDE